MTRAAIHTYGMGGQQLTNAVMANAIRVFNAGGMGLRGSGTEIGTKFKAQVQKLYRSPGTGKSDRRFGEDHRSSSPGQPPARRTGRLHDSVQFAVYRLPGRAGGAKGGKFVKGFGKTEIVIYTRIEYALYLEQGTKGTGKSAGTAPRPVWVPVHKSWSKPGEGMGIRGIYHAIRYGKPDNFVAAERRAAKAMMLANPATTFARETSAGR